MLACLWRPRYRFPNYSQGMLICVLCVHNKSVNPVIFRFNTPEFSMSPECVRCPWLQAETKVATILGNFSFGPSEVHALPLAAGINEGGHYFRY